MDSNTANISRQPTGEKHVQNGFTEERLQSLNLKLQASNVKRYHTFPIIGEQTVGTHTHRVLLIVVALTDGQCSPNLLKAAMFHDLAEIATGDVPATTKWANPDLATHLNSIENEWESLNGCIVDLTYDERRLLKTADMLELLMFAAEQVKLGNTNAHRLIERGTLHLVGLYPQDMPEKVRQLINAATYSTRG